MIDLYLCGALAPAVVVCRDRAAAAGDALLDSLSAQMFDQCVPLIRDVDPKVVKMSRAMYDSPKEVRSLRDEILDLLDGGAPRVAVEIVARSSHEQLLIREMVEDSPSVDAQTCHKRILHKEGLLFVVRVGDGEISPPLLSRASIVLE